MDAAASRFPVLMPMRQIQLPLARTQDLSTPDALRAWNQGLPHQTRDAKVAFWRAMTGLTIAQELALRLGRTPDLVSTRTVQAIYEARLAQSHASVWEFNNLKLHNTIWARTHHAVLFRVTRKGGKGRLGAENPLRPILEWAEPDDVFEDRFVLTGYDHGWGERRRRAHLRQTLRDAKEHRYVVDVQDVNVPARVWAPHHLWCADHGVRPRRVKPSALAHGALAVEAALMRQGSRDTTAAIVALRSEADLTSIARRRLGAKVKRDDTFAAQPDLEIETRGAQYFAVEVLSQNYRDADIKAKVDAIQRSVEFVATSRTVAQRAVKAVPYLTCFHF